MKKSHLSLLTNTSQDIVWEFIRTRPIHSFGLASFISLNGLESPENRGSFYGYFNEQGTLSGLALLGYFSFFETDSLRAIKEFVRISLNEPNSHLLVGKSNKIKEFWCMDPKKVLHEDFPYVLLIKEDSVQKPDSSPAVKLAMPDDLEKVVFAHSQASLEIRGVNPLDYEADQFRERCLKRIKNRQTWIYQENDEVVFKAEMMCQTPELAYLEGVWVSNKKRGNGYGSACLSELCHLLLKKSKSICLLTDAAHSKTIAFYQNAGFVFCENYTASLIKP